MVARAGPRYGEGGGRALPAGGEEPMVEIRIPVKGMTCGGCAATVERALSRVDGVQEAHASFEQAQVVVRFDDGRADRPGLVRAIENAGYDVPTDGD